MEREKQIQNWVLIGESGCGKTELAIHIAKAKRKETKKRVTLIDLDQTKGMFRSRDFAKALQEEGVEVIAGAHFMDMPVIPHGVGRRLLEEDAINILDVGGNEIGAVSLGQFSEELYTDNTKILYCINPYRNFSGTTENIKMLMEGIQRASRTKQMRIVCNPNVGQGTTAQEILEGYTRVRELLLPLQLQPEGLILPNWVDAAAFSHLSVPIWVITPCMKYP